MQFIKFYKEQTLLEKLLGKKASRKFDLRSYMEANKRKKATAKYKAVILARTFEGFVPWNVFIKEYEQEKKRKCSKCGK